MKKILLSFIFVLFYSASSESQTITSHNVRFYNASAAQPLQTTALQSSAFQCGQVRVVGNTLNPTRIAYNDPANQALDCVYNDSGTGPISSAPTGTNLEATLTNINSIGESPESNRAPFLKGNLPPAPGGLRLYKP